MNIMGACNLLGRTPGKDLLVVGYDNYWKDFSPGPWTPFVPAATVDKDNTQTGRMLVRLLLDRASGRLPDEPQRWRVEPKLLVTDRDIVMQQRVPANVLPAS